MWAAIGDGYTSSGTMKDMVAATNPMQAPPIRFQERAQFIEAHGIGVLGDPSAQLPPIHEGVIPHAVALCQGDAHPDWTLFSLRTYVLVISIGGHERGEQRDEPTSPDEVHGYTFLNATAC